ncbi:MAG: hypothetical protein DYG93_00960 [Leptolyngbya sp. PLA2]|nr:hypothetical protein [Leptolyngbya sp. PL-A2]MCQ3941382.1 hypothetical protein [cyanobacterium CYA1]MCZ7632925.1 hypothetical protein [Phycisphaerales bacterium]MDL1904493.1 hypothetical protein [Synechococcales cyanobacterium CNB]GIK19001.1 MAG: hypothetical protein BroJett004_11650 [Planctomycetota bacterium]
MGDRASRIVLVGHCGPDAAMLRSAVRGAVPDASFETANDDASLSRAIEGADLALVNRALEGTFSASDGVELIRQLASRRTGERPALMLVSNYEDAQARAVRAGAVEGFGKLAMYDDAAKERLRRALGASA